MEHLKSILNKSLKKIKFNSRLKQNRLLVSWDDVIGHKLSQNTAPSFIRGKTLFMNVPNSMWAHSLSFVKHEIIRKINMFFGETVLSDIKFQYGNVNRKKQFIEKNDPYPEKNTFIELTESEINKIDNVLKGIEIDRELKHRFKKLMITHYMSKKSPKKEN